MGACDSKASVGERFLASPVDDGPIEGEELMGVRDESFVESAPEGGVVVIMRGAGAEVDGGMG